MTTITGPHARSLDRLLSATGNSLVSIEIIRGLLRCLSVSASLRKEQTKVRTNPEPPSTS